VRIKTKAAHIFTGNKSHMQETGIILLAGQGLVMNWEQ
jgi:hypothetical protein